MILNGPLCLYICRLIRLAVGWEKASHQPIGVNTLDISLLAILMPIICEILSSIVTKNCYILIDMGSVLAQV